MGFQPRLNKKTGEFEDISPFECIPIEDWKLMIGRKCIGLITDKGEYYFEKPVEIVQR